MLASTSAANIVESDLAKGGLKGVSAAAAEGIKLRGAASAIDFTEVGLDINQKVYIDGEAVLGDGAGEGLLGVCTEFDDATVADPSKPEVTVCGEFLNFLWFVFAWKCHLTYELHRSVLYSCSVPGTGIKLTMFLRNRCEAYYEYSKVVGTCDVGADSDTCVTVSPDTVAWLQTAQSFKIEQC